MKSETKPDTERARIYIDKLLFSDSTEITLDPTSVVVIVGPNNSGKSRALNDIYSSIANQDHATLVCTPSIVRVGTKEQLLSRLEPYKSLDGATRWTGPNFDIQHNMVESWPEHFRPLGTLGSFFCTILNTRNRLSSCGPLDAHASGVERPRNPLQAIYDDDLLERSIGELLRTAFGVDLVVNRRAGSRISLYVGDRPILDAEETVVSASYVSKIVQLPMLHDQGDGIQSFASIVLAIKALPRDIILIDEPEAFLHPPQQRLIGKLLAEEQPVNSQILVATHSENIIQGLLSKFPDRVTVIRLTRSESVNQATHLNSSQISELWRSPILRYSNILSGLFHEAVIISEADADCRFYDSIAEVVLGDNRITKDVFHTHSGGKDRMPLLISALRKIGVPVRAIADVDAIVDEKLLARFIVALGGDWAEYSSDWGQIKYDVESKKNWFRAGDLREQINKALEPLDRELQVPSKILKEIEKLGRQTSPWHEVKSHGLPGPLRGEGAIRATAMLKNLSELGLFLVPVGELECFDKGTGGRGAVWVEAVLSKDLRNDPDLKRAREFVSKIFDTL